MTQSIRTFVAIELPSGLRGAIDSALAPHKRENRELRWVPPDNLHLTVKFLGNVDQARVDELVRAVARACELHPAFDLSLRGWGAFPPRGTPRVLWLGVNVGEAQYSRLAHEVDRQLAKRGIPAETRPPSPHLTVARWPRESARGGGAGGSAGASASTSNLTVPGGLPAVGFEAFPVTALSFVRSDLRPGGPVYETLARTPLAAAREGQ